MSVLGATHDRPARSSRGAQVVETFEQRRPIERVPALPRVVQRPSELLGSDFVSRAPKIVLSEPTAAEIEATERKFDQSRKVPIGLLRPANWSPSNAGSWSDASGQSHGRVWAVTVQSTSAFGVRVHFANFNLPESARLVMYPERHPELAVEYREQGPFRRSEFWSPPMYGDTVVLELYESANNGTAAEAHYFDITGIVHEYRNVVGPIGTAGSCNLNAVCYPDWASQGDAVGRIAGIDSLGEFACSGTLVANSSGDFSPLFLTATHCVYGEPVAESAVVYWMYKTATCTSTTPPSIYSVPTTVGAALVSVGDVDASLLYLTGYVPSNIPFEGWTTADPNVGDAITQIHHPQGSYRRISFGNRLSDDPNYSTYHQIQWTSGVTEPGSSGSPGFNASKQIVGALSLGSSSCSYPQGSDYVSKFSLNYDGLNRTGFENVLTNGTPLDQYATHSTRATAAVITSPPASMRLIGKVGHDEWLAFQVPPYAALTITIDYQPSPYDNRAAGVNTEAFVDGSTIALNWLPDNQYNKYFVRAGSSASTLYFHYWDISGAYSILNIEPKLQPATVPVLQTGLWSNPTADQFQVGARGDGSGLATDGWFQWGTDPAMQVFSETPKTHFDARTDTITDISFAWGLTGLTPNTTYYVRSVAQNSIGFGYGNVLTVTTQTAQPNISVYIPPFNRILVGQTDTQCYSVYNFGNTSLAGLTATATPPFYIQSSPTYGPYACIKFAPTTAGTFNGSVTVSLAGTNFQYPISALAQYSYADVHFSPVTQTMNGLTFSLGSVIANTSLTRILTITNSGGAPLQIYGIDFVNGAWGASDGEGNRVYNLQNGCIMSVAPGASCQVAITFSPTALLVGLNWGTSVSFTDNTQIGSHGFVVSDPVVSGTASPSRPSRPSRGTSTSSSSTASTSLVRRTRAESTPRRRSYR